MKNRIVEEMRGDRQSGNAHDRSSTPGDQDQEMRPSSRTSAPPPHLSAPYGSVPSSQQSVATTVAYPYSAWNVSGAPSAANHVTAPPNSGPHKGSGGGPGEHGLNNSNHMGGSGGGGNGGVPLTGGGGGGGGSGGLVGGGPPAEPKPLLSSQYEELSDEDDGNGN